MQRRSLIIAGAAASALAIPNVFAQNKKNFTVAWSHYIGWEPIGLMAANGMLKKWADQEGITITVKEPMAYVDSFTQFNGGSFDAVTITNMDALLALNAVESEVLVVGDYSNGNDGVVLRGGATAADIKGRTVQLVEGSVSQFVLARMLALHNLKSSDVKLLDVKDENLIVSAFTSNRNPKAAVVTWNPFLVDVRNARGSKMVFDSSQIPGEVMDMIVVRKDAPASFKRALSGAWYETVALLASGGAKRAEAMQFFASAMSQTVAQTEAQLKTTAMYYRKEDAVAFTEAADLKRVTQLVVDFAKQSKLNMDIDQIGVKFPDGSVIGNTRNVRLTFTSEYMK